MAGGVVKRSTESFKSKAAANTGMMVYTMPDILSAAEPAAAADDRQRRIIMFAGCARRLLMTQMRLPGCAHAHKCGRSAMKTRGFLIQISCW